MTILEDRRTEAAQGSYVAEPASLTRPAPAVSNRFSPEVVDKLLGNLSSDQAFRDLFEKNPRAALRQVGHETPEADRDIKGQDPVLCCYNLSPKGLASNEAIRVGRERMKAALTSTQSQTIFNFSAD